MRADDDKDDKDREGCKKYPEGGRGIRGGGKVIGESFVDKKLLKPSQSV